MKQLLFARLLRAAGSIWESRHKKKNVKMTDHFTALFLFCTFCPVRRVSSSVMGINSIPANYSRM